MKRIGVIWLGIWLMVGSSFLAAENLVKNPGFEIDANQDGIPDGWRAEIKKESNWPKKGNPVFKIEKGYEGKSASIENFAKYDWGEYIQDIKVEPNKTYLLTLRYKTASTSAGRAEVVFIKDLYLNNSINWNKIAYLINSGDRTSIPLRLVLYNRPGQKVWFDNVRVEETTLKAPKYSIADFDKGKFTHIERPVFKEVLSKEPGKYIPSLHSYFIQPWGVPKKIEYSGRDWLDENIREAVESGVKFFSQAIVQKDRMEGLHKKYGVTFEYSFNMPKGSLYHPQKRPLLFKKMETTLEPFKNKGVIRRVEFHDEPVGFLYQYNLPEDVKEKYLKEIKDEYGYGKFGVPDGSKEDAFKRIAFRRWMSKVMGNYQKEFMEKSKSIDPTIKVSSSCWMFIHHILPPWDFTVTCEDNCEEVNIDAYPSNIENKRAGCGAFSPGFAVKLLIDVTGKPCLAYLEGFQYGSHVPSTYQIVEDVSQALRCGASTVNWYEHNCPYIKAGSTKYTHPKLWRTILECSRVISKVNKIKFPEAKLGILYSMDSYAGKEGRNDLLGMEIYSAHAIMGQKVGTWYNFISNTQIEKGYKDISQYPVFCIPLCNYERPKVVEKIEKYVAEGGTLIVGDPYLFEYYSNGEKSSAIRKKLCGVSNLKSANHTEIKLAADQRLIKNFSEKLVLYPDEYWNNPSHNIKIKRGVKVIATYEDGSPAIILNSYKKGKVIYFSFNPFIVEAALDKNWISFFFAFQKGLGLPVNQPIWRFQLPVDYKKIAKEPIKTTTYIDTTSASSGTNLVKNPGFEIDANQDGIPDNWSMPPGDTWVLDKDVKHSGSSSLKMSRKSRGHALAATFVSVQPGITYELGMWLKSENLTGRGSSKGAAILYSGQEGKHYFDLPMMSGTKDWKKITTKVKAKGNSLRIQVGIFDGSGSLWLDDISLQRTDKSQGAKTPTFPAVSESGKIILTKGSYRCNPKPNMKNLGDDDPTESVLVNGNTRTSMYAHVARWWQIPSVDILFDLKKEFLVKNIKVYTTVSKSEKIDKFIFYISQDGVNYIKVGEIDNRKAEVTYPKSQIIVSPVINKKAKYVKVKVNKNPASKIFQISEIEIYGKSAN